MSAPGVMQFPSIIAHHGTGSAMTGVGNSVGEFRAL